MTNNIGVEERYSPWLFQVIDMIAPKNLYAILGRGSGKTSNALAERSMDIAFDMPGANIALSSDTYMNANENVVKTLMEGWQMKGWREDIHYVVGKRPPKHFKKPYKPVLEYKHVLSTAIGTAFKVVSQDRPSIAAGDSFQHIIGDEGRYQKKKKLDKLTPAIRGGDYVRFSKSPYYRGHTFFSDWPDPSQGDDDWMLSMAKFMDPEQIRLIYQAACIVNELKMEKLDLEQKRAKTDLITKRLAKWEDRWRKIRKNSTLFVTASSFVNVDILTLQYFIDTMNALQDEFGQAVLTIPSNGPNNQLFYPYFSENHKYEDGYNYDFLDQYKLGNDYPKSCSNLKYLDRNKRLEGGFDAGNMMSLVLGQTNAQKKEIRVLKCMHTVAPAWLEELATQFVTYFKDHKYKVLDLYYDRSANAYSKAKKDFAGNLKNLIEKQDGKMTGWTVNLKSRKQGNITHTQEYDLMINLMDNKRSGLPKLLVDKYECRPLISSVERARVIIEKDRSGRTVVKKDKTEEKKYLNDPVKLVWRSTNYSDAFKYLICRPEWLQMSSGNRAATTFSDPSVMR